jgi:GH25 family lysozyme M1 (1,4-beta-N-acetylmuramidase)
MARRPGNTADPGKSRSRLTGVAAPVAGTDAAPPAEPAAPPPAAPPADKPGLPWLVDLLDRAIKEVPYVRYAFGLVGVAAAAALVVIIFKFVGNEFSDDGSMLGMFVLSGFMVVFMFVLFLFARIEDKNKRFLQLPAKIVAWLSVAIVIALVIVATSIGIAQYPPHLAEMVFAKPANPSQKLLRDKFKSRQDYAQYCSDFDKEADHAYVELCINSSMKDFFQECSGFTPPAPEDEEQRVDDFACIERTNHGGSSDASPDFGMPRIRLAAFARPDATARPPLLIPVQADDATPCRDTILGRLLADGKAAGQVKGFDISHHDKNVPWDELIREGNVFVMMKATEGTGFTDTAFLDNWREAGRRGLIRGAYHVMRYGPDTDAQITQFASALAQANPRRCDLGAVLDLKSAARGKPVPDRDLAAVKQWLDWSQRQLRKPAVLFADTFFLENFLPLSSELLSRSIVWLQEFSPKQPAPPNGYSMPGFIWQFSDGNDNVPEGFNGFGIDRDVFLGSAQDFARLLNLDFSR